MNEDAYQNWQILHRRVARGEALSAAEQTAYDAGCREIDAQEPLDGNLEKLRALRAQISEAETEQQVLLAREKELDVRIALLEARLDESIYPAASDNSAWSWTTCSGHPHQKRCG